MNMKRNKNTNRIRNRWFTRILIAVTIGGLPWAITLAGEASDEIYMEHWMTVPFETGYQEEEFNLEQWMSAPFETGNEVETRSIESWMQRPFTPVDDQDIYGMEK
jgi:hypothetical protein